MESEYVQTLLQLHFYSLSHVYSEDGGSMFLWIIGTIYQIMWSNIPEGHNPKDNILLYSMYARWKARKNNILLYSMYARWKARKNIQ
jgi:hypothetical protein